MTTASAFTSLGGQPPNAIMKVVSVSIPSSSSTGSNNNSSQQVVIDCEEKEQAIQACLQGRSSNTTATDDQLVDLWQLRQLALLPGGLLCPSLRKSAWPKLTGVSDAILRPTSSNNNAKMSVSQQDIKAMQQDIFHKTIWNVEEQCKQSRLGKEPYWFEPFQAPPPPSTSNKSVTFADPPEVTPSPSSVSTVQDADEEESIDDSGAARTPQPPKPYSSTRSKQTSSFAFSSIKAPQVVSSQERSALHHIMLQVLQRAPHDLSNTKRLHYPPGLSNLAALLWINLESASLTSLLLYQLASFQLNEAFHGSTTSGKKTAMNLLSHLLEHVDQELHSSLQQSSNADLLESLVEPSNVWFAKSESNNVRMASRLLDVLVASHPLMPVYMAAAFLKQHKSYQQDDNQEQSKGDERITMTQLEHAIATALSYMEQLPPSELMSQVSPSTAAQEPPAWAIAPTAPTDVALFRNAREARDLQQETKADEFHETLQHQQEEPFSDEECSYSSDWESLSLATIEEALNESRFDDNEEARLYLELEAKYRLALVAAGVPVTEPVPPTPPRVQSRSILVSSMILDDDDSSNLMFPELVRQDSASSLPASFSEDSDDLPTMTRHHSSPALVDMELQTPVSHRGMPWKLHRKLVGISKRKEGVFIVAGCTWTWHSVRVLVVVVIVVCSWWMHFALPQEGGENGSEMSECPLFEFLTSEYLPAEGCLFHGQMFQENSIDNNVMEVVEKGSEIEMVDCPLFEFLTSDNLPKEDCLFHGQIFGEKAAGEKVDLSRNAKHMDIVWVPNDDEVAKSTKKFKFADIDWVPNAEEAADAKFERKLEALDALRKGLSFPSEVPYTGTLIQPEDRLTLLRPFMMQMQRNDRFWKKVFSTFPRRKRAKKNAFVV